jgi:hypothetical protein
MGFAGLADFVHPSIQPFGARPRTGAASDARNMFHCSRRDKQDAIAFQENIRLQEWKYRGIHMREVLVLATTKGRAHSSGGPTSCVGFVVHRVAVGHVLSKCHPIITFSYTSCSFDAHKSKVVPVRN